MKKVFLDQVELLKDRIYHMIGIMDMLDGDDPIRQDMLAEIGRCYIVRKELKDGNDEPIEVIDEYSNVACARCSSDTSFKEGDDIYGWYECEPCDAAQLVMVWH